MTDFIELCRKEPRLKDVQKQAEHEAKWRKQRDYNVLQQYKSQISQLVGWYCSSTDSVLCSPQAYDIAYQAIADTLDGKGGA